MTRFFRQFNNKNTKTIILIRGTLWTKHAQTVKHFRLAGGVETRCHYDVIPTRNTRTWTSFHSWIMFSGHHKNYFWLWIANFACCCSVELKQQASSSNVTSMSSQTSVAKSASQQQTTPQTSGETSAPQQQTTPQSSGATSERHQQTTPQTSDATTCQGKYFAHC